MPPIFTSNVCASLVILRLPHDFWFVLFLLIFIFLLRFLAVHDWLNVRVGMVLSLPLRTMRSLDIKYINIQNTSISNLYNLYYSIISISLVLVSPFVDTVNLIQFIIPIALNHVELLSIRVFFLSPNVSGVTCPIFLDLVFVIHARPAFLYSACLLGRCMASRLFLF